MLIPDHSDYMLLHCIIHSIFEEHNMAGKDGPGFGPGPGPDPGPGEVWVDSLHVVVTQTFCVVAVAIRLSLIYTSEFTIHLKLE